MGCRGYSDGPAARVSDKKYTGPELPEGPRDSLRRYDQGLVRATGGAAQVVQTWGTCGADTAGSTGASQHGRSFSRD